MWQRNSLLLRTFACKRLPTISAHGQIRFKYDNNAKELLDQFNSQRFYKRWLEAMNLYTMGTNDEAYHPYIIDKVLKADRLDLSKWQLIYFDFEGARVGAFLVLGFAAISITLGLGVADYIMNGKSTMPVFVRLIEDAEELENFIVIPAVMLVGVVATLFRLHTMKVFRIYQNMLDPTKFTVISPGLFQFRKKMEVARSDFFVHDNFYTETNFIQGLRDGNMRIGKRKLILCQDSFRSPQYKAYMFSERDVVPPDLRKTPMKAPLEPVFKAKDIKAAVNGQLKSFSKSAAKQPRRKPPAPPPM